MSRRRLVSLMVAAVVIVLAATGVRYRFGELRDTEGMKHVTYMFLGTAHADSASTGYPKGERHAIIVFALAEHLDRAAQLAERHFVESGWADVELEEGAELDPEKLGGSDPEVIQSYEDCLAHGTAGIVFSDPLDE